MVYESFEGPMVIGLLHREKVAQDEPGESDNNPDVRRHQSVCRPAVKTKEEQRGGKEENGW